jgi:glutamine synthetase
VQLADDLRARGVHTLLVQFTDAQGVAKGKLLPLHQLPEVLATAPASPGPVDRRHRPAPHRAALGVLRPRRRQHPQRPALDARRGAPVGDGFVDGQPFDACPRQVLRRARAPAGRARLAAADRHRARILPAARVRKGRWRPADEHDRLDKPSVRPEVAAAPASGFLHALREALEACGLTVLQIDHEDAHGQYESTSCTTRRWPAATA